MSGERKFRRSRSAYALCGQPFKPIRRLHGVFTCAETFSTECAATFLLQDAVDTAEDTTRYDTERLSCVKMPTDRNGP